MSRRTILYSHSFGIGTSTMYLSTVHPLLLLYTYGCLICYRNKGVITE